MKKRVIWLAAPALALGLGACGKKAEPKAPVAVETPAPTPAAPPPAPAPEVKPAGLSAEERAAKLGFVKHLPQDTEVVMAFHNGSKTAERVKSSKLWKLVQAEMGITSTDGGTGDADTKPDAASKPAEPTGPAALFGKEFTIALGKTTGEQTGNLLTLNRRMSYFQMRELAKAFVEAAKTGDFSEVPAALNAQYGPELFKNILADPQSGAALFEKMNMPPIYLAFRATTESLPGAAQQLSSLIANLGMMGETVEPVEVEKGGAKFTGQKISGAKISAQMAENRSNIDETFGKETADKLIADIAKKDVVVLSGTVGDYAVMFIGSSVDDLKFAPDTASSMVSGNTLAFADPYIAKDVAAVIYGEKPMLDTMLATVGGLSDMATGLRDGLAGSEGLGDTRDLETLLRMVAERETALRKLAVTDALGMVAFFENGLKIESQGGIDKNAVDWKSPNKLTPLGEGEDVAMFLNMTGDAAHDEKARAYIEALLETAYAAAMKVSELKIDDDKMASFQQGAKLFDTKFRADTVALWDAMSGGFGGSLGHERALVVDLGGSMPAIPGVPQPVVDEAKFPRVSLVAPVTDRAKLAESWQKMNASLTKILKNASEIAGQDIPMQKPISSEKDGLTTWFFSMPFFNDDFLPSVTVGDKWFAASSSKNQALDLIGKAEKGGETRTGAWFSVNFNSLRKFSEETVKVLEKNKDATGVSASDLEKADKFIKACEDLDKLTVHARREAGALRTSVHFKTR